MRRLSPFLRLATLAVVALPAPAFAWQAVSAASYEGTYTLSCTSAAVHLDMGIQLVTPAGSWGWSDAGTLPLACATDPADIEQYVQGLEGDCIAAGLPAPACHKAGDDLYAALLPLSDLGQTTLPTSLLLDVDMSSWAGPWWGLYYAQARHTWADGHTQTWGYLFDNNVGYGEGHLASAAIGVGSTIGADSAGCAVTGTAVIDAYVKRTLGYSISGTFGVNQSLTCAAGDNAGSVLLVTIGLSTSGTMAGVKVP